MSEHLIIMCTQINCLGHLVGENAHRSPSHQWLGPLKFLYHFIKCTSRTNVFKLMHVMLNMLHKRPLTMA